MISSSVGIERLFITEGERIYLRENNGSKAFDEGRISNTVRIDR